MGFADVQLPNTSDGDDGDGNHISLGTDYNFSLPVLCFVLSYFLFCFILFYFILFLASLCRPNWSPMCLLLLFPECQLASQTHKIVFLGEWTQNSYWGFYFHIHIQCTLTTLSGVSLWMWDICLLGHPRNEFYIFILWHTHRFCTSCPKQLPKLVWYVSSMSYQWWLRYLQSYGYSYSFSEYGDFMK